MNKKGVFNFVWLFAIIAGSAILLLAIYGAVKGVGTEDYRHSTELAKAFTVVLGASGAGVADVNKLAPINLNNEIRLDNTCSSYEFGENSLSVALKSSINDKWQPQSGEITMTNQYVFSSSHESKRFDVFSMPFNYPFKIADLVFITSNSESFCLVDAPNEFERTLRGLQLPNWKTEDCLEYDTTVCFKTTGCDINVHGTCVFDCDSKFDEGYVEKEGDRLYFVDGLIYGAILTDKELYDCNVNRLIYRASSIADVLAQKASRMDARGCPTNIQTELTAWSNILENLSPEQLTQGNQQAKQIQEKSEGVRCKIW